MSPDWDDVEAVERWATAVEADARLDAWKKISAMRSLRDGYKLAISRSSGLLSLESVMRDILKTAVFTGSEDLLEYGLEHVDRTFVSERIYGGKNLVELSIGKPLPVFAKLVLIAVATAPDVLSWSNGVMSVATSIMESARRSPTEVMTFMDQLKLSRYTKVLVSHADAAELDLAENDECPCFPEIALLLYEDFVHNDA